MELPPKRTVVWKRRKLIYTAGPYRADTIQGVVQNIREAEYWAARLWAAGASVICPHKNTGLLDGIHGMTCQEWLAGDFEQIIRCGALFLLPNWHNSKGTLDEIAVAQEYGIRIFQTEQYPECVKWLQEVDDGER
jgi:hypothetical protein